MKRVEMMHQAQFEQYINLLILYKVQNPGKVVYLNENLFSKSFGEILSVLLHELCHVFGGDGRRSFSDILTYLIRVSIDERNTLDKYALLWKNYKINESDRSRIAILKPIQSTLADKIAEYRKNLER